MTKYVRLLAVSCITLLGFALGTQQCVAGGCDTGLDENNDPIPIPGCFYVTRDAGILAHASEQLQNAGTAGKIRGQKSSQNVALIDFDGDAIRSYIEANPGIVSAELFIQVADRTPLSFSQIQTQGIVNGDVGIQTVESLNDWAEGEGNASGDWNNGSAATYFYASTVRESGTLKPADSLQWVDPDSGPYTFTSRDADYAAWGVPTTVGGGGIGENPTPEFTNSEKFLASELLSGYGNGEKTSVAIDAAIVNAIAYDPNNRGLRFGETFLSPTIVDNSIGTNWRFYDKDNGSSNNLTPFIQLTISPGQAGDFDGDLDVDGADFLTWQRGAHSAADLTLWENNFGSGSGAQASVGAVPEPSSMALLALTSALLFARRNSRR